MKNKLIIIDCDGVLYQPTELDINAIVYAFNDVCDKLHLYADKVDYIENATRNKEVKGFFNYIQHVANKAKIPMEKFISLMVQEVDYSQIKPDSSGILSLLMQLAEKYQVCIYTNNHLQHLNQILKAKLGVCAADLPFPCFDICSACFEGVYHHKESHIAIQNLEKRFQIPARCFYWIDDTPSILKAVQTFQCQGVLINHTFSLTDALKNLNNEKVD